MELIKLDDVQIDDVGSNPDIYVGSDGYLYKRLSPHANQHGYPCVGLLDKEGNRKTYRTHRIVAGAFIPNPDNLPCVNHKDEVKSNNQASNLEWCSWQYNNNYGTKKDRTLETRKKNGRKAFDKEKYNATRKANGTYYMRGRKGKEIQKIDMDGNVVAVYSSLTEAAKDNYVSISQLSIHVNTDKPYRDYFWIHEED